MNSTSFEVSIFSTPEELLRDAPRLCSLSGREPRVLMFSQRHLDGLLSRCSTYEFEDVICEIDDVTLVAPKRPTFYQWRNRIANRLAQQFPTTWNPGLATASIEKDYDLFFALASFPSDLSALHALPDWRRKSRKAICWIEELWPGQLKNFRGYAHVLAQFDHIIIGCNYSVEALRRKIPTPCHYLPPGVDTIRFSPYPEPAPRSIHIYSLGRRAPLTHQALLRHCQENRLWYVHDTVNIHDAKQTDDPVSHRNLVANTANRSRFFVANAAKLNLLADSGAQPEIGPRFFEGAAAGAVMFGAAPDTDIFRELFDWPDAVLPVPFDSPNVPAILAEFNQDSSRMSKIRSNNMIQSLRRHDWLHRWRKVLELAELSPTDAFANREERLHKLAQQVSSNPEPS